MGINSSKRYKRYKGKIIMLKQIKNKLESVILDKTNHKMSIPMQ